jgi:hypothetical protein
MQVEIIMDTTIATTAPPIVLSMVASNLPDPTTTAMRKLEKISMTILPIEVITPARAHRLREVHLPEGHQVME